MAREKVKREEQPEEAPAVQPKGEESGKGKKITMPKGKERPARPQPAAKPEEGEEDAEEDKGKDEEE